MPTGSPLTPEQRQQCLDLHEFGLTRGEIAAALSISDKAVTVVLTGSDRAVAQIQVTTGDVPTELMGTAERLKRLETKRLRVAELAIQQAELHYAIYEKPFVAYNFGGRENEYREETLSEMPVQARRELAQAISILAKVSVDAIKSDSVGGDTSDLDVWLQGMGT